MVMTALERKALFKAAVTLQSTTMAQAAKEFGVSYNHLVMVLRGDRIGSEALETRIAAFVGKKPAEMFGIRNRRQKSLIDV